MLNISPQMASSSSTVLLILATLELPLSGNKCGDRPTPATASPLPCPASVSPEMTDPGTRPWLSCCLVPQGFPVRLQFMRGHRGDQERVLALRRRKALSLPTPPSKLPLRSRVLSLPPPGLLPRPFPASSQNSRSGHWISRLGFLGFAEVGGWGQLDRRLSAPTLHTVLGPFLLPGLCPNSPVCSPESQQFSMSQGPLVYHLQTG